MTEGRFREDLYYRLKVVTLQVPPLRSRPEDIAALASHFLARHTERFRMPPVPLTPAVLERLTAHPWPGNVRELENALESAVVLSADGTLDLEQLPGGPRAPAVPAASGGTTLRERLDAHERELILAALAASKGQRTEAARALGIGRATLHDKLRKHGLQGEDDEPER